MTQGCSRHGMGLDEPALLLAHAEIGTLEQFGGQNDLGSVRGGLADQVGDLGDVGIQVLAEARLQRGDGDQCAGSRRNLLADAMERAAAGKEGRRGQGDHGPVREQAS